MVNISSTTTVNGNPPAITVANIGGYGFNTLQDAVKWHAEHNSTANIVLLRDVSLTENLVITRDVTIVPHSSNGYGLSSDGGKISVADNATLTIDGKYSKEQIADCLANGKTYGDFFLNAPALNPKRKLITGKICGINLEEIDESLMQEIRYLDKLVDELAKGRPMEKILRK